MLHVWQAGKLPVEIVCVISNHERGENTHVIRFLERNGIPYHYVNTTTENKREEEILNLVQDTDFLVLARYMQILSGNFLRSYGKDVINIHHGLLPSFKGGFPSKQAFDAGVKLIGATSHFVTEELDAGPIIEQMVLLAEVCTFCSYILLTLVPLCVFVYLICDQW
ncbi:Formyltetrahydrofolate deformylase 1, mitochondrial [Linum perenne]